MQAISTAKGKKRVHTPALARSGTTNGTVSHASVEEEEAATTATISTRRAIGAGLARFFLSQV